MLLLRGLVLSSLVFTWQATQPSAETTPAVAIRDDHCGMYDSFSMFYVYVIESESTGSWYIGYSSDLRARVARHNANGNASTSGQGPWRLIYYEAYVEDKDARGREKFLKSGSGWKFLRKQMVHYLEGR